MRQRKENLLVESDEHEIWRQKSWGNVPAYFSQRTHPHICTNRFPISEAALAALAGKALEMYVHIGKGPLLLCPAGSTHQQGVEAHKMVFYSFFI